MSNALFGWKNITLYFICTTLNIIVLIGYLHSHHILKYILWSIISILTSMGMVELYIGIWDIFEERKKAKKIIKEMNEQLGEIMKQYELYSTREKYQNSIKN